MNIKWGSLVLASLISIGLMYPQAGECRAKKAKSHHELKTKKKLHAKKKVKKSKRSLSSQQKKRRYSS